MHESKREALVGAALAVAHAVVMEWSREGRPDEMAVRGGYLEALDFLIGEVAALEGGAP